MDLPKDCTLTYIVQREAWYATALRGNEKPGLSIQASADGGGVAWEFCVEEHDLDGPTVQLKMFADSFAALAEIPEFFAALAELHENRRATLAEVREILDRIGARDDTDRVGPHEPAKTLGDAFAAYEAALADHTATIQAMRASSAEVHADRYLESVKVIQQTRADLEAARRVAFYDE